MANDSADTSKDSNFAARLDAAFALWDAQIRAELRSAFARARGRGPTDPRQVLEALTQQLQATEHELTVTREELSKARMVASDWENKAMLALREQEEKLAHDALLKHLEYQTTAEQLALDEELFEATASELRRLVSYLSTKVE